MIVVTGGAGFIGSNLVAALEARGHRDIVVCDRLGGDGKWRNLRRRAPAELVAPEELPEFLDAHAHAIALVFHLGAISTTTETDADLIVASNFKLSQMLWRWCVRRGARLIYASSAATYGDGAQGFDDDRADSYLAKLAPLNAYGWSKHIFDRFAVAQHGAPAQWAGLKFFNVFGPNEYHKGEQRSVAHKLWERARDGLPARLFRSHRPDCEDGGQSRDFVWVGDCVAVMLWLMDNPRVSGLFNVGSGEARSFLDVARAVYAAAGRNLKVEFIDIPDAIRAQYQYFTRAKMERLRAAGFVDPATGLEDAVAHYVRKLESGDPYL
jgi:ADP-L-glycero-D-manno-heptose 6-epimerase